MRNGRKSVSVLAAEVIEVQFVVGGRQV